jgi:anti-sigma B factor antagonist
MILIRRIPMTINVKRDFELVTLEITGRLDTITAPKLDSVINELSADTKEIVFDMSGVEYISSAGIRVLIGAYKKMNFNQGIMRIEKANDLVHEVFEMTGLSELLGEA